MAIQFGPVFKKQNIGNKYEYAGLVIRNSETGEILWKSNKDEEYSSVMGKFSFSIGYDPNKEKFFNNIFFHQDQGSFECDVQNYGDDRQLFLPLDIAHFEKDNNNKIITKSNISTTVISKFAQDSIDFNSIKSIREYLDIVIANLNNYFSSMTFKESNNRVSHKGRSYHKTIKVSFENSNKKVIDPDGDINKILKTNFSLILDYFLFKKKPDMMPQELKKHAELFMPPEFQALSENKGTSQARSAASSKQNIVKQNIPKTNEKAFNSDFQNRTLDDYRVITPLVRDKVTRKIIGQNDVVDNILTAIISNQLKYKKYPLKNVLLDGSTGTGKTAIVSAITKELGIPFKKTDSQIYSPTSFKGADLSDILFELLQAAGGDIEKAQRGVIVFDEFDKLAGISKSSEHATSKLSMQRELLKFVEGNEYTLPNGKTFDTSNLTFIFMGAFTDLREQKNKKSKSTIGFASNDEKEKDNNEDIQINPEEMIDFGFERELIGRIKYFISTKDYTVEDLKRIIIESETSAKKQFEQSALDLYGVKIKYERIDENGNHEDVEDEFIDTLAQRAHDLKTGARAIETLMSPLDNNIESSILLGDDSDVFYITPEMIEEIYEKKYKAGVIR